MIAHALLLVAGRDQLRLREIAAEELHVRESRPQPSRHRSRAAGQVEDRGAGTDLDAVEDPAGEEAGLRFEAGDFDGVRLAVDVLRHGARKVSALRGSSTSVVVLEDGRQHDSPAPPPPAPARSFQARCNPRGSDSPNTLCSSLAPSDTTSRTARDHSGGLFRRSNVSATRRRNSSGRSRARSPESLASCASAKDASGASTPRSNSTHDAATSSGTT